MKADANLIQWINPLDKHSKKMKYHYVRSLTVSGNLFKMYMHLIGKS